MASNKDFTIGDLSGGFNDSDPPTSLEPNQCVTAENIDFFKSPCGARRKGCVSITLPSNLTNKDAITFLYKHQPASDASHVQLWALGSTLDTSIQLAYKDTTWNDVAFIDAPVNSGVAPYQFAGQSLHGKLFIAYRSNINQLHVFDGVNFRAAGLLPPDFAPTAVNTGVGAFATTRYYRVRETIQDGSGATIVRSEPSDPLTFIPSGAASGAVVTKPITKNVSATHWELEASMDNTDFYIIATQVLATTTYTDSRAAATGYVAFVLSEDIGDYTVIPSGRYLLADEDRLLIGGSFDSDEEASVVRWTPVNNDPGVGNDERIPIDTDNLLNLDGSEGGGITALVGPIFGSIFAFKQGRIYKLTRTGERVAAYTATVISRTRGAVAGSVVEAVDEGGRPALYFLDPKVGPVRFGDGGFPDYQVMLTAGSDIFDTWGSVNLDASIAAARAIFYPDKQQIYWFLATGDSEIPNLRICLQLEASKTSSHGMRLGWTKHTGTPTNAVAATLFPVNIEDNGPRGFVEKPFVAVGNKVLMLDEGNTDNGDAYTATIVTKPYLLGNSVTNRFGIRAGSLIGEANASAAIEISLIRDFGRETSTVVDLSLNPVASEDPVVLTADALRISECKAVQVKITDGPTNASQWALHRIDLVPRAEETD